MPGSHQLEDKELIDSACRELGISLEELGERLQFKSIRRYRNGEFRLTDPKRQHIQDLVAIYKVRDLRSAPSNMPPHQELPPGERLREDPPPFGSPGDFDFVQCIKWLSELHERHPQAFRSAAAMIKGLHESMKK